ncbi:hypothetical protein AVEN_190349-1 [Araneus ventricosus]|uniref:Uncharacterized protein n=1 Tax=Araneus ventricosus TaxID=182803 RepID=A0A4Y2GSP5_ARAVE|nr:hypothetical protein AVEN_190349-1 [Araneus ventricosus]
MRKLNIIVWCLDRKGVSVICGIIRNPPHTRAYDTLKSKIIDIFSQTESAQLKLLLSDKLPTHLLLVELQNLSARKLIDDVWCTFWQQRLPIYVQQILSICNESLGELAMVADKIFEISYFHAVSEVREKQDSLSIQALRDEISVLSAREDRLSKQQARSSFRWRRNRSSQSSGQTPENLSIIRTLGLNQLELDFGLRPRFSFRFIIADNSHPIINENFLERFGLIVDVKNRRLIHNLTTLVSDVISFPGPTLDWTLVSTENPYQDVLVKYPGTLYSVQNNHRPHRVTNRIETFGPPVFSKARRLSPLKHNMVGREFSELLKQGIIRPSVGKPHTYRSKERLRVPKMRRL